MSTLSLLGKLEYNGNKSINFKIQKVYLDDNPIDDPDGFLPIWANVARLGDVGYTALSPLIFPNSSPIKMCII